MAGGGPVCGAAGKNLRARGSSPEHSGKESVVRHGGLHAERLDEGRGDYETQARGEEAVPGTAGADVSFEEKSLLERRPSNFFDGGDPTNFLKALVPTQILLGLPMLLCSLLAFAFGPWVPLLFSCYVLLPACVRIARRSYGVSENPDAMDVVRGRMTDTLEGEFCVMLIGARNNGPWKLTREFKWVGDSFQAMIKELERLPGNYGYLGGESYVGTNTQRGSHVMACTYWRSYEHLLRYTHGAGLAHPPVMARISKKLPTMPEIGVWHEVYVVAPGGHESVFTNCPPLGIGAASGLVPAVGSLQSSAGRLRASSGPRA